MGHPSAILQQVGRGQRVLSSRWPQECVGVGEHASDVSGEPTAHDVLDGHPLEDASHARLGQQPDVAQCLDITRVEKGLGRRTTHVDERAVDGSDDVSDGDLVRRAR